MPICPLTTWALHLLEEDTMIRQGQHLYARLMTALLLALLFAGNAYAQVTPAEPSTEAGPTAEATRSVSEMSDDEIRRRAYALRLEGNQRDLERAATRHIIAGAFFAAAGFATTMGTYIPTVMRQRPETDAAYYALPASIPLTSAVGTPLLIRGLRMRTDALLLRPMLENYEETGDLDTIEPDVSAYRAAARRYSTAGIVFASGAIGASAFMAIAFPVERNAPADGDLKLIRAAGGVGIIAIPAFTAAAIQLFVVSSRYRRAARNERPVEIAAIPRMAVTPTRGGAYTQLTWNW